MAGRAYILPVIVFAQFCCTSLWFAGNAVLNDLILSLNLPLTVLGYITAAVQLGFIAGTLFFAVLSVADRFSPSRVFFFCALAGGFLNLGTALENNSFETLGFLRFLTGFSLAGIYPVGMKIAADHFEKGLGKSLGFLVGALVLGTAFPHLLRFITGSIVLPWKAVIISTSILSLLGGSLILIIVPDGPYRKRLQNIRFGVLGDLFKISDFRRAASGYFGHMWELYAYWAFAPVFLIAYYGYHGLQENDISLWSFLIIATGGIGCVAGGYLSGKFGTKKSAATALFLSGLCCLLSPFFFLQDSLEVLLIFLVFWGFTVVADSPLFSTLVAQNSPANWRGTALTIVNSIGFAITILSILLLNLLLAKGFPPAYLFLLLLPGPILGLLGLYGGRK
ncbi:MFS transporter [Antarcticibacterium flavum]|uniref:MFS transporter n=1 Tax=Antarcticibacterium flavum TaxID=2058175 RepID=A0A5B7X5G3_9FLAO|nr:MULTISPECIES: MFS transporter [Antarcticibacterium]MCM4161539.1 MFS transporter [Antarcticibacterium sp. W02-3]QCY69978.1 MFS transporter [Antarcticibacterium flavum]